MKANQHIYPNVKLLREIYDSVYRLETHISNAGRESQVLLKNLYVIENLRLENNTEAQIDHIYLRVSLFACTCSIKNPVRQSTLVYTLKFQ